MFALVWLTEMDGDYPLLGGAQPEFSQGASPRREFVSFAHLFRNLRERRSGQGRLDSLANLQELGDGHLLGPACYPFAQVG